MNARTPDPKDLASRITRYSNLRAAERAVAPTVRSRSGLPSYHVGRGLLEDLQALRAALLDGDALHRDNPIAAQLSGVDGDLDDFSASLCKVIEATPMVQFRATLPGTVEQAREEAEALLDLCLEPGRPGAWPRALIDYVTTLLAVSNTERGTKVIQCDPCEVTARLAALSREQARQSSGELERACKALRDAAIELLSHDDLEPTIRRMRDLKDELGDAMLHPEVLRAVVAYNVATHNRLLEILSAAREFDRAADEALESLRALDRVA